MKLLYREKTTMVLRTIVFWPMLFKDTRARIEIHVSTTSRSLDAYVNDYRYCRPVVTKKISLTYSTQYL